MKACKYCDAVCAGNVLKCDKCGASKFSNVCESCGEIFDSPYCPNCGVRAGNKGVFCPNCGKRYFLTYCPNCGYSTMKKNRMEPEAVKAEGTAEKPQDNLRKRKKAGIGGVLLAIFIPYIALVLSTFGRLYETKEARMGIAAWNLVIAIIAIGFGANMKGSAAETILISYGLAMMGLSVYSMVSVGSKKD